MATNANSYFSNSAQGIPGVAGDFDLFASHTTPRYALGHMIQTQDGKIFRYAHFGAATNQGRLVSQDISESGAVLNDITVVAPASAITTTDGTTGYKFVEATEAAVTSDQYAGGYLITTAGTGRGYSYRIAGNTKTGLGGANPGPASGNLRIELYDKLQASLTADTDVIVIGSMYQNLENSTGSTDVLPVGVCMAVQAADDYGWVQTRGVCGVFQDGDIGLGRIVVASNVDAGGVAQIGEYTASASLAGAMADLPIVGWCIGTSTDGANGIYVPIFLTLE